MTRPKVFGFPNNVPVLSFWDLETAEDTFNNVSEYQDLKKGVIENEYE